MAVELIPLVHWFSPYILHNESIAALPSFGVLIYDCTRIGVHVMQT